MDEAAPGVQILQQTSVSLDLLNVSCAMDVVDTPIFR